MLNLPKISVQLSYMLRHCTDPLYVDSDGGWAPVDVILADLQKQYPTFDRTALDILVANDQKGRYSFDESGTRIRANQGHSIQSVSVEMTEPAPPELLYHGTATRFLPVILKEGLRPMERQFVHISADYETAAASGSRHGKPAVVVIRAADFVADGHKLYRSSNGVWQATAVPPEYLSVLEVK